MEGKGGQEKSNMFLLENEEYHNIIDTITTVTADVI
jgi:hypothetical protein